MRWHEKKTNIVTRQITRIKPDELKICDIQLTLRTYLDCVIFRTLALGTSFLTLFVTMYQVNNDLSVHAALVQKLERVVDCYFKFVIF